MRYLVFEFDRYYPVGGMEDCTLKTNKLKKAMKKVNNSKSDYRQVYDVLTDTLIVDRYLA